MPVQGVGSLFGVALAVLPVVLAVVATRGDAAAIRMPVFAALGLRAPPHLGVPQRAR
jgi:hypothetical protein